MSSLVHQWLVVELRSDGEREEWLRLDELAEGRAGSDEVGAAVEQERTH
jgi:hypothetical protein